MSEKEWNTRLRYIKIGGKERTQIPVICNKMVCHGYVKDNEWYIVNLVIDCQIKSGVSTNNEEAKRELKNQLILLGGHFVEEVRATKDVPVRMLTKDVIDDIITSKEK